MDVRRDAAARTDGPPIVGVEDALGNTFIGGRIGSREGRARQRSLDGPARGSEILGGGQGESGLTT